MVTSAVAAIPMAITGERSARRLEIAPRAARAAVPAGVAPAVAGW